MKKIIILLLFVSFNCSAQYYEWMKGSFSNDGWHERVTDFDFVVGRQGMSSTSCYFMACNGCDLAFYEQILDRDGTILNYYSDFADYPRKTFFDANGYRMHITTESSGYKFDYIRPNDTLTMLMPVMPVYVTGLETGHFFLFYNGNGAINDSVEVYDFSGTLQTTIHQKFVSGFCDTSGYVYLQGNDSLRQYYYDGTFITSYNGYPKISDAGIVWSYSGASLYGVDNGIPLYIIPVNATFNNDRWTIGRDECIYTFFGNSINKYRGDTLIWQSNIDPAGNEKFGVDDSSNIYFSGMYRSNMYDPLDGTFTPNSIAIPPFLYDINTVPDTYSGEYQSVFIVKINSVDSVPFIPFITKIGEGPGQTSYLCTASSFNVYLNLEFMPVEMSDDSIYIELSDSAGSFTAPLVIGAEISNDVDCFIPESVPAGYGYRVRFRIGNSFVSQPHDTVFTINISPAAHVVMNNSIANYYFCPPLELIASPVGNYNYEWQEVYNPGEWNESFDVLTSTDSSITLTNEWYVRVKVTDNLTGCYRLSSTITEYETIDTSWTWLAEFYLPDSIRINDTPYLLPQQFCDDTLTGNGLTATPDWTCYNYTFNPAVAGSGYRAVTHTMDHYGNPCVPFVFTDSIYVDSIPANIVMDYVDSTDHLLCVGQDLDIHFTLLDSTVYDSTNVFIAEAIYDNYWYPIKIFELGRGIGTVIHCIVPNRVTYNFRVIIRSTQTGEISTLNKDGALMIPIKPYANLYNSIADTTKCLPLAPIAVSTSSGYHSWFRNDTLVSAANGFNIGINPATEGTYHLELTDNSNFCVRKLGPFIVDHNAHVPVLTFTPVTPVIYKCNNDVALITVVVDTPCVFNWFAADTLFANTSQVNLITSGLYPVTATTQTACPVTVYSSRSIVNYPSFGFATPGPFAICEGDSVRLSVNTSASVKWMNSKNQIVGTTDDIYVSDTGSYYVVVTDVQQNCIDTGSVIYVGYKFNAPSTTPSVFATISTGNTVTLSANNIYNYSLQWNLFNVPIPGATDDTVIVSQPGQYFLAATDSTGCTALSPFIILKRQYRVNTNSIPPSQIRNESTADDTPGFNIYPNPANDFITIKILHSSATKVQMQIIDVAGRLVKKYSFITESADFEKRYSIADLSPGSYTVELLMDDHISRHSLVISR